MVVGDERRDAEALGLGGPAVRDGAYRVAHGHGHTAVGEDLVQSGNVDELLRLDFAAIAGPKGVERALGIGAAVGVRAEVVAQPLGERGRQTVGT